MIPDSSWFVASAEALVAVVISAVVLYLAVILYTRIAGLRSFSKMSAFDFAMTIAVGSVMASTIVAKDPPIAQGLVALGVLFASQWLVAWSRRRTPWAERVLDNRPVLLMLDGEILEDNLTRTNVTREDLIAKLREANALTLSQVRAVVLETTGDVSVLHGGDDAPDLDPILLEGVVGRERLTG